MPDPEVTAQARKDAGSTAGKSLKRLFGQDDALSRIESQEATASMLMNGARFEIFLHLCQNPCSHSRAISRALGRSLNATAWHLKRLLQAGYLESAASGGKLHYWPAGMVRHEDADIIARLRDAPGMAIAKAVIAEGGSASQASIARRTGTMQQTVNARLAVLVDAGALEKREGDGGTRYSLSGKALALASGYKESAGAWAAAALELFKADGLFPKRPAIRGTRLRLQVALPSGKARVVLECNPMAFLEKMQRSRG